MAATQTLARVAGLSYIIIILLGICSVNYITSSVMIPDSSPATVAANLIKNEVNFRLCLIAELLMYALVIFVSWAFYIMLKPIHENLALLALLWRVAEAIVGVCVSVLSGVIPMLLVKQNEEGVDLQFQALLVVFLDIRSVGLDFVLVFVGLGGSVFSCLFLKSNYVPKMLASWGILTYSSMLALAIVNMLFPLSESTKMSLFAPGGVFEIVFGLWLLLKGVDVHQKVDAADVGRKSNEKTGE